MPFDPDTAIGGPHDRFPSTRLSLIENLSAVKTIPSEARERIAALYWKPIYKYVRLKWRRTNEEAKDLTQGFFASALEREFFERFDPARASFRTYLRMAVDHFAANALASERRQKRGGGTVVSGLEGVDFAGAESPEQVFEREWQRQLFALAIDDLRAHCEQCGKAEQFEIFEAYDLAEGERPSYADLAARHEISAAAVTNHLAWARRMLRGFVSDRLRGVTAGDNELRSEMRSALGRPRR